MSLAVLRLFRACRQLYAQCVFIFRWFRFPPSFRSALFNYEEQNEISYKVGLETEKSMIRIVINTALRVLVPYTTVQCHDGSYRSIDLPF